MKASRQNLILEIISEKAIETQDQLRGALLERGVKSTQATLSRDIKELRLMKELSPEGEYRYVTAPNDELRNKMYRLRTIFEASVMSVDHAGNIVVVKTLPGLGNAAGEAIDSMDLSRQVGSLAGDNTVFVVMRDEDAAKSFTEDVKEML